jgi:hypothetical protein
MRRALRAAAVVALGAHATIFSACSTEANTITLLNDADGGKKPEPEPTSCSGDGDCTGSLPSCSPAEHRCVECLSATQCPTGYRCAAETRTCEPPCKSRNECSGIDRPICSATGVCVQCESDGDCGTTPTTPHCNLRNGLCVQCLVQADCGRAVCFDDCYACMNNACVWRT